MKIWVNKRLYAEREGDNMKRGVCPVERLLLWVLLPNSSLFALYSFGSPLFLFVAVLDTSQVPEWMRKNYVLSTLLNWENREPVNVLRQVIAFDGADSVPFSPFCPFPSTHNA